MKSKGSPSAPLNKNPVHCHILLKRKCNSNISKQLLRLSLSRHQKPRACMQINILLKLLQLTGDTSTYDEMPEQLNFSVMLTWRYNEFTELLIRVCLVL